MRFQRERRTHRQTDMTDRSKPLYPLPFHDRGIKKSMTPSGMTCIKIINTG